MTGLILAVRSARGSRHDFKVLKKSGLEINENARIKADKGFQGIKKLYPQAETPYKETKRKSLTREQKKYNRELSKERIKAEHRNRECKIFRICGDKYRGKHRNYEKNWKLVAAIVNLKLSTRHLKPDD